MFVMIGEPMAEKLRTKQAEPGEVDQPEFTMLKSSNHKKPDIGTCAHWQILLADSWTWRKPSMEYP